MTNIPPDTLRTMASELDKLIGFADSYKDHVLGALLCTVRDYIEPNANETAPPSA